MVKIYASGAFALLTFLNSVTGGALYLESKTMFLHLIVLGRVPYTGIIIEFEYIALPILVFCMYHVLNKLHLYGREEVKRVAWGAKEYLETISI